MHFNFSEEQRLFQQGVSEMLAKECNSERIRGLWDSETGRSPELWAAFAGMGVTGLMVDDRAGGLGMNEVDFVLLLEETGRVAVAEPLVDTAFVASRLIEESEDAATMAEWLPRIASGDAIVAVGHDVNTSIADLHVADLVLICKDNALYALDAKRVGAVRQASVDPGRRLFTLDRAPEGGEMIAEGFTARQATAAALDRGALGVAAQQLGIGQRLIEMGVAYAKEREQFGKPIGSFQAVKHMLASVQVRVEFARPVVYRAAFSVAHGLPTRATDVSQAKAAASEAALLAVKTALQVHGAIGYTSELDLHMWMKRAWSLEAAWGTSSWHRARVADSVLDYEAA
jgi:alkylation response protein AidB-like acyl-CoA dehydrogenase